MEQVATLDVSKMALGHIRNTAKNKRTLQLFSAKNNTTKIQSQFV